MKTKLAKAGALDVMRDFPGQLDSELSTQRCLERLVIAGTPQSVADQILAFRTRGRRIRHAALHRPRLGRSSARPALHGAHGKRGLAPDRSSRAWDDTANGWNGIRWLTNGPTIACSRRLPAGAADAGVRQRTSRTTVFHS